MISFPDIDPVIFRIGPLSVRWYSVMYLTGFIASYFLVRQQLRRKKIDVSTQSLDSLYMFLIFGLITGARIGYIIFYNLRDYLRSPLEMFAIWQGGMSFHGGLIGCLIAGIIFCKRHRIDFWQLSDLIALTVPIGLGLGRLGNFINGELYGRATDVPWGMIFPSGGSFARHPSQLYEFMLEGVALFAVLWFLRNKNLKNGALTSLFLILYGAFRFFVEFFRQPDPQIGFIFGYVTMGQILCLVMILSGAGILIYKQKQAVIQ